VLVTELTRLLLDARRIVAEELGEELAERGYAELRPSHAAVFGRIDRRSGSRITDLAEASRVSKQGMMALVDDLEAWGYVRRVRDPADARAKLVRLTASGRRAAAECRRAVQSTEQRTRRRLGDRTYRSLRDALETLTADDA
jgi:DNA-binding MarR family transcriptional regulator